MPIHFIPLFRPSGMGIPESVQFKTEETMTETLGRLELDFMQNLWPIVNRDDYI